MEQSVLEQILDGSMEPTDLPLETLRQITDNFSRNRIIGEGGFGTVYEGVIQNRSVAVKKIMSSKTINEKLFRREVDSLMEVNHQNIVKFLGFCSHTVQTAVKIPDSRGYIYAEKRERLLCFEYISNGSLDKHITDELRGLEWDTRYQVINGICTGLYYLHMEKRILHMDLKPANILMDHQMVPKITDFGLSRSADNSQTTSTSHFASFGYSAPENMFGDGRMCVKSDIYSLGKIIIEIVTGHKDIPDDNKNILRRWRHRWNKSGTETPVAYQHQVMKYIEMGLMCQSIDPDKRPLISDIMNEIGEMESMNNNIKNADEPAKIGQINSASWEDDMLGVEPLELRFANFDHNYNHISSSCSVELSNNTDSFIAFIVQTTSPLPYSIDPNNRIVPPQTKLCVNITLPEATQDHHKHYKEQFIVRSTKVGEGLTVKDINQDMFDNGKDVDEVHLPVVSEAQLQATSRVFLSEGPSKEVVPLEVEYSRGMLLNVHPLVLRFPFIPKKSIPCSLHLTNHTDEHVVFRLTKKNVGHSDYLDPLPLHDIVPPSSTYTLVLSTSEMEELPGETNIDLILQNSVADRDIPLGDDECDQFFEEVKETGDTLNEVTLQAVCAPIGETINEIIPRMQPNTSIYCLDAHPTEPWIAMGLHNGVVQIWNYETQRTVGSAKLASKPVHSVKFVVRKQWLLAGDGDGCIHVRDYGPRLKRITTRRGHSFGVTSLSIHPTKPYVLSSTLGCTCLWDWDNDWEWKHVFYQDSIVNHVVFDPMNHDSFASASRDRRILVWKIDPPEAIYTLSGHSDDVTCLDFFTRDEQLYLISCSNDRTAKVWDLKEKTCVHTIGGFRSPVTCVISLPDRPYLLTGSKDGLVHLWSSYDFRLERTFDVRGGGDVRGLICLTESKGFVIGQHRAITVMDMDNEEWVASKGTMQR